MKFFYINGNKNFITLKAKKLYIVSKFTWSEFNRAIKIKGSRAIR